MKLTDSVSLQPLVTGGHTCETDGICGEGRCLASKCVCNEGWMGPRCLVGLKTATDDDMLLCLGTCARERFPRLGCWPLGTASAAFCSSRLTVRNYDSNARNGDAHERCAQDASKALSICYLDSLISTSRRDHICMLLTGLLSCLSYIPRLYFNSTNTYI